MLNVYFLNPNMPREKREIAYVLAVEAMLWSLFAAIYILLKAKYPETFALAKPLYLLFNLLVYPVLVLYVLQVISWEKWKSKWPKHLLSQFFQAPQLSRRRRKVVLLRIAAFFMIVALAQPILGKKKAKVSGRNAEIVVALDISNSMNTRDISTKVSRLDIAKRALIQLVNQCRGEKIGLVIFAENAFVQLPITKDYGAAKMFIQDVETKMISNQGTNFSAALNKSMAMFSPGRKNKGIILLTDGENHSEVPAELLEDLKEDEVLLSVVGIGTKEGGPIPKDVYRQELGYKANERGQVIVSKVDETLIRDLAKLSGGLSILIRTPFPNLSDLLTEINRERAGNIGDLSMEIQRNLYAWPLAAGLFLCVFVWISPTEKLKRVV